MPLCGPTVRDRGRVRQEVSKVLGAWRLSRLPCSNVQWQPRNYEVLDVFSPVQISELVRVSVVAAISRTLCCPGVLLSTLHTPGPRGGTAAVVWYEFDGYRQTADALARRPTSSDRIAPALRCGHCPDRHGNFARQQTRAPRV